jgi:hypothetical protein
MKTSSLRKGIVQGLALLGMLAMSHVVAPAANWVAVTPMPGWVAESLDVTFTTTDGQTVARYEATVPTPCHRLAPLGGAQLAGNSIACDFQLQTAEGVECVQILSTASGTLELGALEPGDYTFVAKADGQELKRFSFTVPKGTAPETLPDHPVITSIRLDGGEVVVSVAVPAGVTKVTLEARTRLGAGTWAPRAVQRTDGSGKPVTFRLARSEKLEMLRVRGDAQEALPSSFYAGTNTFNGQASAADPLTGGWAYANPTLGGDEAVPGAQTREVVESDIWKIRGDTLYFFNQYRGLQVIDLGQPDAPVLRGTLELAAAGEQMYVLDDQHALLLARDGCGWAPEEGGQALIVDVSGQPRVVASVPIPGEVQESRLVGTALYVASQVYRKVEVPVKPDGGQVAEQWEWGSVVSSYDLANPTAPVARDTLWYPGWGNVIMATDRFLFVVNQGAGGDWWQSDIRVVDISAPDGAMRPVSTVRPAGRVADKFKMNLAGDVFTVVSEYFTQSGDGATRRVSELETFSLADPAAPRKLGQLEVGRGEGLYATRFDGERVYIVTFLRIDPLWVVDLKDPANPKLAGELQVPGWSTYIQPLGDRLVAIGIDNSNSWKVAVSLFDVRDPANPGLLAKVPLGESSSWSEANSDEKALTVLPEAGLILVPYGSWGTNGWANRVQLIDLGTDTLAARGVIEHTFQPRRATVHGERIVSISGRELLMVNATDRDHPAVTADLELSWAVNRLVLAGDYLIEQSDGGNWNQPAKPVLRVTRAAAPDEVLSRLELAESSPVLGATVRDGRLYLVQGVAGGSGVVDPATGDGTQPAAKTLTLFLSVFDLGNLPELRLLSQAAVATDPLGWSTELKPLWPKPGLLVWSGNWGQRWWWWWRVVGLDAAVPSGAGVANALIWPGWSGGGNGRLLAFDVSEPAAPKFMADTVLSGTNGWWTFSDPFVADGLVHLSHQASEFIEGVTLPGQVKPTPTIVENPDGTWVTNVPPVGIWVSRYYLDVVDYADPATPTVRKPVNIPGTLKGLSHNGAVLYTTGPHWDANGNTDWSQYLDACAYDGVQAALITSLKLPTTWPQPLLIENGAVMLGRADDTGATGSLETWRLAEMGQFLQAGAVKLSAPAQYLAGFGSLLAVELSQEVELYDSGNPEALVLLGSGKISGCYWPSLSNGDGSLTKGLWLPLDDYGVLVIPIPTAP